MKIQGLFAIKKKNCVHYCFPEHKREKEKLEKSERREKNRKTLQVWGVYEREDIKAVYNIELGVGMAMYMMVSQQSKASRSEATKVVVNIIDHHIMFSAK